MHHNIFGKKLNRDTGQRQALLKGLAGAFFRSESIETTEAKAKASVSVIENLITLAKKGSLSNIRQIEAVLTNRELVEKLVHTIAPRFKNTPGGYIRLIRLGNRVGDNAPMMRMELTAKPLQATDVIVKSPTEEVVKSVKPKSTFKPVKKSPAKTPVIKKPTTNNSS